MDENAIVNTIFDAEVLKAFVQTLPSFYDGVDLTGKGNIDSKGGFNAVLHPNEMVLSEANRKDMIGEPTTRDEVITGFNLGRMILDQGIPPVAAQIVPYQDDRVLSKLSDVEQAIKQKPVFTGMDYNKLSGMVADKLEGQKKVNTHRKIVRRH